MDRTAVTNRVDIGEVVRRTGVPATTLHVWERHALISVVGRDGLRRQYDEHIFERLATIVVLKDAGFRLDEIATLLEPDAFEPGKQLLEQKISELRERRDRLDDAIAGIGHAIECTNPNPFECGGFQAHLDFWASDR